MSRRILLALTAASAVLAQRPNGTSICDYYTTALLKNNTAENQYTVVSLVVNTAVIGNYTTPNVGISVPGILAPGTYNGEYVNLLPYFNGQLASSNRGGSSGVSVNFLDSGGAAPIKANKPADDNTSNQYFLLTHLYQFFGSLLGCSEYGMGPAFPAYGGHASMYEVHKFMDLDAAEVGWFIQNVGMAAQSFGVAAADAQAAGSALNALFGYRCEPPAVAIAAQGAQLQSICIAASCPLADGAVCDQYAPAVPPANATANATAGSTATATGAGASATTSYVTVSSAGFSAVSVGTLLAACLVAIL